MEQLDLNLFDLPSAYAHAWEGLPAAQQTLVLEILAGMMVKSIQADARAQEATSHE